MTDPTRITESPKPSLGRRQFTLRQMFVTTTVVAALMACFVLGDVVEVAACLLYILLAAAWFVLLYSTAAAQSVFRRRTILLGIVASGLHFWLLLWMTEGSGQNSEFVRVLVKHSKYHSLPPFSITLALLVVSLWALGRYHTDRLGKWAGRWTLALLSLYCFVIAARLLYPGNTVRGDDYIFLFQYPVTFVACMPWAILWRRRQLHSRPFASTRWDTVAKWFVFVSYLVIALTWLVIAATMFYGNRFVSGSGWVRFEWVILIWLISVGGHLLAGLFFALSNFIQWFRDRWRFALNLPGVLYLVAIWLICLFKLHAVLGF